METKTPKFKMVECDGDGSSVTFEREIYGRLTPDRLQTILEFVDSAHDTAPYGISPNGYSYRCGCVGDCCGCLIGTYASMIVECRGGAYHSITIRIQSSYNY